MPDPYDGNESQVRIVARQVVDAFTEQQDAKRSKLGGSLPAWIAVVLSLGAVIWNAAITSGDVSENRRRIEQVESEQLRQSSGNTQVIDRLARIEAKLDLMGGGK